MTWLSSTFGATRDHAGRRRSGVPGIEAMFRRDRFSNHSAQGQTLRHLVELCEAEGWPYVLRAWPGRGYVLDARPGVEGGATGDQLPTGTEEASEAWHSCPYEAEINDNHEPFYCDCTPEQEQICRESI